MEGARRLALVLGLVALVAGCGSSQRLAYSGRLYSVQQVRTAFDTLGLELKPTSTTSGRVVLWLHKVRLGPAAYPVGSRVTRARAADVEVIVLTRRDGAEGPGTVPDAHVHLTRYANVTLVAGRDYNDEARAALSVLRWTLRHAKPAKGRIVLGRSIGVVSIGEPRKQVEKVLGKGVPRGRGLVSYPREHFFISYAPHDTLVPWVGAIFTRWSGLRGPAGVRVGSTRGDLKQLYAGCSRDQCGLQAGWMPDAVGTTFTLRRGKVAEIFVSIG
jgi:hypothetical protein